MEDRSQPVKPAGSGVDDPAVKSPLVMSSRQGGGTRQVRVTIGGASRDWWKALHEQAESGTMPPALRPLADGTDGEVTLSPNEWSAVRAWASALPGWVEGDGAEQLIGEETTV